MFIDPFQDNVQGLMGTGIIAVIDVLLMGDVLIFE